MYKSIISKEEFRKVKRFKLQIYCIGCIDFVFSWSTIEMLKIVKNLQIQSATRMIYANTKLAHISGYTLGKFIGSNG